MAASEENLFQLITALRADIRQVLSDVAEIRAQVAVLLSDSKRHDTDLHDLLKRAGELETRVARGESKIEGGVSTRALVFAIIVTAASAIGGLATFLSLFGNKKP